MKKKRCTKCGEVKPLDTFSKNKACKDGLASRCKQCDAEYKRQYYIDNREACDKKAYKWRAEHREVMAKVKHKWYVKNRDAVSEKSRKYYAENRDAVAEKRREYCDEHPEILRLHSRRRRARKINAAGYDYTTAEHIAARCEVWGNKCYICGGPMEAVDHVKPLAKGGAHFPCNLRPICASCNSSKSAKWPVDFESLRC